MRLVITNSCIGPKGAHLERGTIVDIDDAEARVHLVGSGKALNAESEKGKAFIETLEGDKLLGKTAKK